MWPALIFAANRKDKVNGRTKILVVSIKIKNGFSQVGAPSGNRWAIDDLAFFINDEMINDIHNGKPKDIVKIKWLDNLNVYGFIPIRLIIIIDENKIVIIKVDPFNVFVYVFINWLLIFNLNKLIVELSRLKFDQ